MGNLTPSQKQIMGFSVPLSVTTIIAIVFIILYMNAIDDNSDDLCNNLWVVDKWSDCNSSSGPGTQTRAVSCPDKCDSDLKPEASRICSNPPCA